MFFGDNFEEIRASVFHDDNYTESEYKVSDTGKYILYIDHYKTDKYHFVKCQVQVSGTKSKEVVFEFERTTPYCKFQFFMQNDHDWLYSPVAETFIDLDNKKMYDSYNPNHVSPKWVHSQISPDGKTLCVLSNMMGRYNLEFYDLTRFKDKMSESGSFCVPFQLELPTNFYDLHRELGIGYSSYEDETDFMWNNNSTFTYKIQKEYCLKFGKYSDFLSDEEYSKIPHYDYDHHVRRDLVVRSMKKDGNDMVVFDETKTPYYDTYLMQRNNI